MPILIASEEFIQVPSNLERAAAYAYLPQVFLWTPRVGKSSELWETVECEVLDVS